MAKRIIILLFISMFSVCYPQPTFYTQTTTRVGPGIVYKRVVEPRVPWSLDVLEIDLSNPFISIESVKAQDRLYGNERTSSMAARKNYLNHGVVGAINGDFYGTGGIPINAQVVNGELLKYETMTPGDTVYWSTIGFDDQNHPAISYLYPSSYLFTNNGRRKIDHFNQSRQANQMILYNSYFGTSTGTNPEGVEVLISPISEWMVNDTIYCVVETVETGIGNITLVPGKAVLSGSGEDSLFLMNNVQTGDTLKLFIGILPSITKLMQLVGGFPKIVKDGANYALQGYQEEGGSSTFATDRHPRTGIGYSMDSTKLYMVTVDGRQTSSKGMNLIELANFMTGIGVYSGINLDGGGSTTMVVRGYVRNSPSDPGGERAVGNALLTISSAPEEVLNTVQIEPDNYRIFHNTTLQFNASGWDQYFNLKPLNPADILYTVDPSLGVIDANGLFTAADQKDSGYVYVNYQNIEDSAFVYIKTLSIIKIKPEFAVTDTIHTIQFKANVYDDDGINFNIPNSELTWQSLNTSIGVVDSNGLFRGISAGSTQLVVTYNNISDTANVAVEIGSGSTVLDSMDVLNNWSLTGQNYDSLATILTVVDTPRTFGSKAFKLHYEFVEISTQYNWVYLNTDIPVFGVPEFIKLDFKSDGWKHRVYFEVSDADGSIHEAVVPGYAQNTIYDTLSLATYKLSNQSNFNFPLRIKKIKIRLGKSVPFGQPNIGDIYIDNLRIVYPDITGLKTQQNINSPKQMHLYQNYPNPFNPITNIQFEISTTTWVKLTIFDILGREIEVVVNKKLKQGFYKVSWNAHTVSSGVYFYRLETPDYSSTMKMILIH